MHRLQIALAAAAAATTLAVAAPAGAFCRTTTIPIPAGYDPSPPQGCITGTPLAWPSMPVTYQLQEADSRYVTSADATPIVDQSFAKWAAVSCSATDPTVHPSISFRNLGPTTADFSTCEAGPCGGSPQEVPHVILFRDGGWPYNDTANTLALTTITYGVDSGHIYAADMEINSSQHMLSTVVPPPMGSFSLQAIVTHEAGHFIGIAHSQLNTAVMFAHYQPDAVQLTADDIAAVCAAYPPSHPSSGCSCVLAGRERDAWGACAGLVAAMAAAALASARRRWTAPSSGRASRPSNPVDGRPSCARARAARRRRR